MRKVFLIKTKAEYIWGNLEWYEFGDNIQDAISKVQSVISNIENIESAEFVCNVDEDKDLEEYKRERGNLK
jgi:hypothetical protein